MAGGAFTIDPDNDTGTDYTSLSAWEAGENGSLTEDLIANCRSSSGTADSAACNFSGVTLNGHNIIVQPIAGQEASTGPLDTSIYRLAAASDHPVNDPGIIIDNIQIVQPSGDHAFRIRESDFVLKNCFIEGHASGFSVFYLNLGSAGVYENNIINGNGNSNSLIYVTTASNKFYNNTLYDGGGVGIDNNNESTTYKNNVILSMTGNCFNAMTNATEDYNIVDDTSVSNTNDIQNASATDNTNPGAGTWAIFADLTAGSEDFAIVDDADNDALDAGIGPGSDSDVPTDDIDGNTRSGSDCDCGASEHVTSTDLNINVHDCGETITSLAA